MCNYTIGSSISQETIPAMSTKNTLDIQNLTPEQIARYGLDKPTRPNTPLKNLLSTFTESTSWTDGEVIQNVEPNKNSWKNNRQNKKTAFRAQKQPRQWKQKKEIGDQFATLIAEHDGALDTVRENKQEIKEIKAENEILAAENKKLLKDLQPFIIESQKLDANASLLLNQWVRDLSFKITASECYYSFDKNPDMDLFNQIYVGFGLLTMFFLTFYFLLTSPTVTNTICFYFYSVIYIVGGLLLKKYLSIKKVWNQNYHQFTFVELTNMFDSSKDLRPDNLSQGDIKHLSPYGAIISHRTICLKKENYGNPIETLLYVSMEAIANLTDPSIMKLDTTDEILKARLSDRCSRMSSINYNRYSSLSGKQMLLDSQYVARAYFINYKQGRTTLTF